MADDVTAASDILAIVGERLIASRTVRGIALEEAATDARIPLERLAEAEAGEAALEEPELRHLADVYGVDVTAFFGGRVTPLSYLAGG